MTGLWPKHSIEIKDNKNKLNSLIASVFFCLMFNPFRILNILGGLPATMANAGTSVNDNRSLSRPMTIFSDILP